MFSTTHIRGVGIDAREIGVHTKLTGLALPLTVAMAVALCLSAPAAADPGGDGPNPLGVLDLETQTLIGADDDLFVLTDPPSNSGVQQFGPYPSTTTDSGTCGIDDWAEDVVDRYFQIQATGPMTYRVIEKFRNGTFQTFAAASPGSCDNSDGTGPGLITPGYVGTFHGYDVIHITSETYNPESAECPSTCFSTDIFLASVFGAGAATRDDVAFFFHYQAANQDLVYHEWKNASCNRGGNHGDIQSTPTGVTPPPTACTP
jgi:hypothetical protein